MNNTLAGSIITALILINILTGIFLYREANKDPIIRRIETESVRTVELPGKETVRYVQKDCPTDPVAEIQKELREAELIKSRLKGVIE